MTSSTVWPASATSSSARSRNATAARATKRKTRSANGKAASSKGPGETGEGPLAIRSARPGRSRAGAPAREARAREEADRVRPQGRKAGQAMKPLLAALAVATAAALGAAGCGSPGPQSHGVAEVSDDAALTAKVKTAIATDVGARAASSINVETYRGVVELSGFVDNQEMASR